ncbi:MAG: c-type cytochrome [Sideroxydans sp.]|nr:c-type cytochrome [Sideroxydans sp.]
MEAPAAAPAAPAVTSGVLTQEQALALAAKGNCLACHKIDKKVVGPAWKDVAAKYRGDAKAAATIASHIKAGGSFGWKFGVMPPRGGSSLPDADVDSLAKFIASLK